MTTNIVREQSTPESSGTECEHSNLAELAAFLNEIRTVWRAADKDQRDRIRRGVLVVLRGNRPPAEPVSRGDKRPLDITDAGWFTERAGEFELMDRDQLLGEARKWAFNCQQAELGQSRAKAGAEALDRDARQRLARVAGLLDPRRPTVRTKDLQAALNPEMYAGWTGYPVAADGEETDRNPEADQ
ncbi:MAG TPA: hypothetical protein VFB06_11610 [Streptosporangiaceae bacterium]|nr:hypothetical protein [Streptosporangiaceae bacterium]